MSKKKKHFRRTPIDENKYPYLDYFYLHYCINTISVLNEWSFDHFGSLTIETETQPARVIVI